MFALRDDSGFTLIELITVIAILGVLAVVVGPRFASTDVFEARTFPTMYCRRSICPGQSQRDRLSDPDRFHCQ
ncbi:MAG: type II secretion system protein [Gammaproteobacteria bacterium]